MDTAITDYIKHEYGLIMAEHTAEAAKIAIGSAAPLANPLSMELKGRCLERGLPRTITGIRCRNPRSPGGLYRPIVNMVRTALERTPPELCADTITVL
jgi:rod shape-determining protein MreB